MNENILLVGKNAKDMEMTCLLLERLSYNPVIVSTLEAAAEMCAKKSCLVALLDFDSMILNNRIIRNFKRRFPQVNLIISSARTFHPELKEAITDHIYACVAKPVDPDELTYWLTSIHQNGMKNGNGRAWR